MDVGLRQADLRRIKYHLGYMTKKYRVAIVGAGFAGLASAVLLARSGHRVTMYEKFAQPQSRGAGVLIQPSGLMAMDVLGITDDIMARGARVNRLFGVNPCGQPVMDMNYQDWQDDAFGVGLHRGVLFEALWKRAQLAGVEMVLSSEVDSAAALADLQKSNDLVVIADGSHSVLRQHVGIAYSDTMYPWGAMWAVLDDKAQQYDGTLWQWYRQANQMLGIMPTGRAPDSDKSVVSVFWSVHEAAYAQFKENGLAGFKQQVLTLNPQCEDLLSQIYSFEQLTFARYRDVVMPQYHNGNTVIIGDAAHGMSPQLGQGTNMALIDAVVLSRMLEAHGVGVGLAKYSQQRLKHLKFYSQASRWLTPMFQSHQRTMPYLRDLFMGRASGWPVIGHASRQMLVGVRQGWLGGELFEL